MITQEFKDFYKLYMGFDPGGGFDSNHKEIYKNSDQYYVSEKCYDHKNDLSGLKLEDMDQSERMKFILVATDLNIDLTRKKYKDYLSKFRDDIMEIKEYNKPSLKKV